MLKNVLIVVGVLVAVVVLTPAILGRERMLALVFGPVDLSPIDFKTLQRSPRPNQYLVCPPDFCAATPDAISPVYEMPASTLRDRWLRVLARQPRVEQIAVSADGWQYDFIQRSWLFRLPDSITIRFVPLGDTRATLAIYSRSHDGRSDFGVNRKRIEAWLKALPPS